MYKVLIVDDEKSGREVLEQLIGRQHPDLNLLPSIRTVEDAVQAIDKEKPDLVFLDVKLGNETGFGMLEKVTFRGFQLVFVTAYSEFALPAIKAAALDYLLKPVNRKELNLAIERFKKKVNSPKVEDHLEYFKKMIREEHARDLKKISFPTSEGYEMVGVNDFLYMIADRNYCRAYLRDGKNRLSTKHLGLFEEKLQEYGFLRIHKSYLVNLKEIKTYLPGNGGYVTMSDGKRLEVSRRKKEELIQQLQIDSGKTVG